MYPKHLYSFYGIESYFEHESQRQVENEYRKSLEKKLCGSTWVIQHPAIRQLQRTWFQDTELIGKHNKLNFEWHSSICISNNVFSRSFCDTLIKESEYLASTGHAHAALNLTGVDLLWFGFSKFFEGFIENILPKLLDIISPPDLKLNLSSNETWKLFHAFVIHYDASNPNQSSHPQHLDDSDLTLNLCLGDIFTGGDLVVHSDSQKPITYQQKPGQLFIHAGNLSHSANPISSGKRYNLVIWLKKQKINEERNETTFSDLPSEIVVKILSFLDVYSLCRVSMVNRRFCSMAKSNESWEQLHHHYVKPVKELLDGSYYLSQLGKKDWYSEFRRSRRNIGSPYFHKTFLPEFNLTFINGLIQTEREHLKTLKKILDKLEDGHHSLEFDLVEPIYDIHWRIYTLFQAKYINPAIDLIFANQEKYLLLINTLRDDEWCNNIDNLVCEIPNRIFQYLELFYSNYPLLLNNIKPSTHSLSNLVRFCEQIQPNSVAYICKSCLREPAQERLFKIFKEWKDTEVGYREHVQTELRDRIAKVVLIAQELNYSIESINTMIDCISECDDIITLSKFMERNLYLAEQESNPLIQYLKSLQVINSMTPFIFSTYTLYSLNLEKRITQFEEWTNTHSFGTRYQLEENRDPFFPGPFKRIPRYTLLANDIEKQSKCKSSRFGARVYSSTREVNPLFISTKFDHFCETMRIKNIDCNAFNTLKHHFSNKFLFPQPDVNIGGLSCKHLNIKLPLIQHFFDSIFNQDIEVVKMLLKMNAVDVNACIWWKPNDCSLSVFNLQDRFYQGTSAIFIASAIGNEELVRILLYFGANPKIPRYDGRTAWSIAKEREFSSIYSIILQAEEEYEDRILSNYTVVPWIIRTPPEIHTSSLTF